MLLGTYRCQLSLLSPHSTPQPSAHFGGYLSTKALLIQEDGCLQFCVLFSPIVTSLIVCRMDVSGSLSQKQKQLPQIQSWLNWYCVSGWKRAQWSILPSFIHPGAFPILLEILWFAVDHGETDTIIISSIKLVGSVSWPYNIKAHLINSCRTLRI